MSAPRLLEIGTGPAGRAFMNVDVLLRTRLLLQANSGGGKSWALRRLAEQLAAGKIQTLIIDPEGEFATLRERFDFVLVGKGGDTPADIRSAAAVAQKLLELNVSAVCDLFEMSVGARHEWVAAFLGALVDAPKELWHPVVIMLDEAHVFAPERGFGESPALDAVSAVATRGRKRGHALVAATQRLGKFSKNVAAELQNVLVGSTFLDVDVARACEVLGVASSDKKWLAQQLKVMEPGQFFGLGRAISTERIRLEIGGVLSSHPEPGSSKHAAEPPPPPETIRKILAVLGDLPKEAARQKDVESTLREDNERLRAELAAALAGRVPIGQEPMIDAREAAKVLGTTPAAVRAASFRGSLPCHHVGRTLRYRRTELLIGQGSSGAPMRATTHVPSTTAAAPPPPAPPPKVAPSSTSLAATPPQGWSMEDEALYQRIKARLIKELREEAPAVLKVLATAPEVEVAIERPTVQADGKTLKGRLAQLIASGFFAGPRAGNAAYVELQRLGFSTAKPNVYRELDGLAALGLLTKEDGGYQVAPGAKVRVVEAGARS